MSEETPANYDHLLDPNTNPPVFDPQRSAEEAAVRPERKNAAATEAARQAGIALADRAIRQEAGLPPREHDLR